MIQLTVAQQRRSAHRVARRDSDSARSCGATDNASDYGSEDSRFESWQDRVTFCARQASHPSRTMVWGRSRRRSSVSRPRFPDRLHHLSSIRASAADATLANGSPLHRVVSHQHRWFSGRMLACHAGGPGSIPGRCNFCLVPTRRGGAARLALQHVTSQRTVGGHQASVAQWLARSAVNRKVGGSTPPGGGDPFATASPHVPVCSYTIVATADRARVTLN